MSAVYSGGWSDSAQAGEREPLTYRKCTTRVGAVKRFRRLRAFLRGNFREAFKPAPAEAPELSDRDERRRGGGGVEWRDESRTGELPPGWQFEALYYRDGRGKVTNTDPTDDEIAGADAIIVSYTDKLGKDYRTIHRADNRRMVGKLIAVVIIPDSPVR